MVGKGRWSERENFHDLLRLLIKQLAEGVVDASPSPSNNEGNEGKEQLEAVVNMLNTLRNVIDQKILSDEEKEEYLERLSELEELVEELRREWDETKWRELSEGITRLQNDVSGRILSEDSDEGRRRRVLTEEGNPLEGSPFEDGVWGGYPTGASDIGSLPFGGGLPPEGIAPRVVGTLRKEILRILKEINRRL